MKRVYVPFSEWEEVKFNMWGSVIDRDSSVLMAVKFTGDHEEYGKYMLRVIREWPRSCLNALTDMNLNRKAWIGHAACALAHNLPENIVRLAWGKLTYEQQSLANNQARNAIELWEFDYLKSRGVYKNMGGQMLFGWDTGRST